MSGTTGDPEAAPKELWLRAFGDGEPQGGDAVVTGPDGSVYVSGLFRGSFTMDGAPVAAEGDQTDILLAKLNPDGDATWARTLHIEGGVSPTPYLRRFDDGDLLVAGAFPDALDLGGAVLQKKGSGLFDLFVARFDEDGALVWGSNFGGEEQTLTGVAVDAMGNIVLSGMFAGELSFGAEALAASGDGPAPFLVKLSGDGDLLWNHAFTLETTQGGTQDYRAGADAQGNVYLAGGPFDESLDLGGGAMTSSASAGDMFLAKFDPSGQFQWNESFPVQASALSDVELVVDPGGSAWLAGAVNNGSITFGDGVVVDSGGNKLGVYVASFDPSGQLLRALGIAGTGTVSVGDLTSDRSGGVVLEGLYNGAVELGPVSLSNDHPLHGFSTDRFIARIDSDGELRWGVTITGGPLGNSAVHVSSEHDILWTGAFRGQMQLGALSASEAGKFDLFVARLGAG